jgi:transposase-like protein
MKGHGAKYAHKMEQAIAALLTHRSVEEAARAVGINANTLLRWMKEPEFEAVCREARRTVFSQAIGRLQDAAGAAATTVLKIMVDPNVPSGTRLRAAEVVLEQAAKAGEIEDIENRVATLERTAGLARKSRKRSAGLTWLSVTSLPCPTTTRGQIAAPPLDSTETDEDVIE